MKKTTIIISSILLISLIFTGCKSNKVIASEDESQPNSKERGANLNDMENRIFTKFGFSIVIEDYDESAVSLYYDGSNRNIDYNDLKTDIELIIKADGGKTANPIDSNKPLGYSHLLSSCFMFCAVNLSDSNATDMTDSLSKIMLVTENDDLNIGGATVKHTTITLNSLFDIDENRKNPQNEFNIFNIPYKGEKDKFYDVIFNSGGEMADKNAYITKITTMIDTFKDNSEFMEYNEDGLAKFTSLSFNALYNPEYFENQLIPYHVKGTPTDSFDHDRINLSLTDDTLDEFLDLLVWCEFGYGMDGEITDNVLEINDKVFEVLKEDVAVKNAQGNTTNKSLIVQITHVSEEYDGLTTEIKLLDQDDKLKGFTFNQEDFDRINSVFDTIMYSYEVDLSSEILNIYDQLRDYKKSQEEDDKLALKQKKADSTELDTEKGFFVNYDPNYAYPQYTKYDDSYNHISDGGLIGVRIKDTVIKPLISFTSFPSSEALTVADFLAPSPSEMEFLPEKTIKLLLEFEAKTETETEIMKINNKEIVKIIETIPVEEMDRYQQIFFDDPTYVYGEPLICITYTYEQDNIKYVIYSTTRHGFINSNVTSEIEFMFETLVVK